MRNHLATRVLAVVALGAIALTALACGSARGSAGPVQTNEVTMPKSYRFSPETIEVAVRATVTWRNQDNFTHSVKLRDGGEPDHIVKPGESVSITFSRPGTYAYECSLHPQNMRGTVIITDAPPAGG